MSFGTPYGYAAPHSKKRARCDPSLNRLVERIVVATADHNLRSIGELTGIHAETVRRYRIGATPPSVIFLQRLCTELDISAQWLLLGQGPPLSQDCLSWQLSICTLTELLAALATRLEACDRTTTAAESMVRAVRGTSVGPNTSDQFVTFPAINGPGI